MGVPVIDLFAGPGGLSEGFSSLHRSGGPVFNVRLSIEKDPYAHKTLHLRAFFRLFALGEVPDLYYDRLAGRIGSQELFDSYPIEAKTAGKEAWHAELGSDHFSSDEVDRRIHIGIGDHSNWVLIGGPPCQAYSVVGRSRRKNDPTFAADEKHLLYRQYLRILAVHKPPIFVMENVKGLLSAKVDGYGIFERILGDLENPIDALSVRTGGGAHVSYRLVSLSTPNNRLVGRCDPKDFVVRAEDHGVPQARHRVILLGIRNDITTEPRLLQQEPPVSVEEVISDLRHLRSGLSREPDSAELWCAALKGIAKAPWLSSSKVDISLRREILRWLRDVDTGLDRGDDFGPRTRRVIRRHREWFEDLRLDGVCNHATRSHIRADLHRYFFASVFAQVHGRSPLLEDMPAGILPLHQNVAQALEETKFNDRFRVQLNDRPSSTITSHISKDGHYYIHYDPTQCRSLTVREAARLQTFPDNYFFEGPRTEQYRQVGNAVPPLLARQIAEIVADLLD